MYRLIFVLIEEGIQANHLTQDLRSVYQTDISLQQQDWVSLHLQLAPTLSVHSRSVRIVINRAINQSPIFAQFTLSRFKSSISNWETGNNSLSF
jgi:hypothetical protein